MFRFAQPRVAREINCFSCNISFSKDSLFYLSTIEGLPLEVLNSNQASTLMHDSVRYLIK